MVDWPFDWAIVDCLIQDGATVIFIIADLPVVCMDQGQEGWHVSHPDILHTVQTMHSNVVMEFIMEISYSLCWIYWTNFKCQDGLQLRKCGDDTIKTFEGLVRTLHSGPFFLHSSIITAFWCNNIHCLWSCYYVDCNSSVYCLVVCLLLSHPPAHAGPYRFMLVYTAWICWPHTCCYLISHMKSHSCRNPDIVTYISWLKVKRVQEGLGPSDQVVPLLSSSFFHKEF